MLLVNFLRKWKGSKKISKKYNNKYVFRNISFDINDNEKLLIIGPSGCGKTTLIRCLNGLNKINSGNIFLNGVKISNIDDVTLKSKVGMVFQNYNLFPHLTVRENVSLAPRLLKMGSDREIDDLVKRLLSEVNIINKIDSYPSKLSGGEKQRVAIARTLATKPEVILFDEPTSALDPAGRKEILDILLAAKEQTTILFSTHILSDVERICTEVAFLNDGKIAMQGTIAELRNKQSSNGFIIEIEKKEVADMLAKAFSELQHAEENELIFQGNENRFFDMMQYISENRIPIQKIERLEPTLETLFLEVTK